MMKDRLFLLLAAVLLAGGLSAASAAVRISPELSPAVETSVQGEGFMLKTRGKTVWVWQNGVPKTDTGISPAALPEEDRRQLITGILAPDSAALAALLEDFGA